MNSFATSNRFKFISALTREININENILGRLALLMTTRQANYENFVRIYKGNN